MYGLIGKLKATPGQRDALTAILVSDVGAMPGCFSYVVAHDPADPGAIARGRPLIAGFGEHFETKPVGGHGLATPKENP